MNRFNSLVHLLVLLKAAHRQIRGQSRYIGSSFINRVGCPLYLTNDAAKLLGHGIEGVGNSAGNIFCYFCASCQVAFRQFAKFHHQLHEGFLYPVLLFLRLDQHGNVIKHGIQGGGHDT